MDEFKDRGHDDTHYPNRPVQRGLIAPRTLIRVGVSAFIVELSAVITISNLSGSWLSLISYLGVLAFSALTFVEFFVPNWLNRHFTIYFLTHQIIFAFLFVWGQTIFGFSDLIGAITHGLAFMLVMAALEVMRKFEIRTNTAGEVVPDTYLAVWGRAVSVGVMALAFGVSGVLLDFSNVPLVVSSAFGAIGLIAVGRSKSAVQATTVLAFFVIGLVAYFS